MNAQTEASIRHELFYLEEERRRDRVLYEPDNAAAIRRCELLRGRLNSKDDVAVVQPVTPTTKRYSPWIGSPEMLTLMRTNGIKGNAERTISRYKSKWQSESQVGTNSQLFRFDISVLDSMSITYPAAWD